MIANDRNNGIHAVKAVYVNGRIMDNVIFADDVKGEVTYHAVDREGRLMTVGDNFAVVTDTGHVEIELYTGWGYDTHKGCFIIVRPH